MSLGCADRRRGAYSLSPLSPSHQRRPTVADTHRARRLPVGAVYAPARPRARPRIAPPGEHGSPCTPPSAAASASSVVAAGHRAPIAQLRGRQKHPETRPRRPPRLAAPRGPRAPALAPSSPRSQREGAARCSGGRGGPAAGFGFPILGCGYGVSAEPGASSLGRRAESSGRGAPGGAGEEGNCTGEEPVRAFGGSLSRGWMTSRTWVGLGGD